MALRLLPEPGAVGALDGDRLHRLLDSRARALAARTPPQHGAEGEPVLLLMLGAETYGLPLAAVAEVLPAAPPSPIPGAPAAVLGLRARAGRLYSVLDLGLLLGGGAGEAGAIRHDVLLRPLPARPSRRLALRVDRAEATARPTPIVDSGTSAGSVAFRAALPAEGAPLVAVLDLERLLRPYLSTEGRRP
ncbi:chemotaxis protein CheW [Muricoccus radiodurans]|uniref:chemotaxis protein CheW n=1 Tax=Muricoccus radiodurans TaxID=2231721 RepID=UPI003CE7432F